MFRKADKLCQCLVAAWLVLAVVGCQPALHPVSNKLVHLSTKYQRERDFFALRWVDENVLREGQARAYVELVLGYGTPGPTGEGCESRMYPADDDMSSARGLLVRYRKGKVWNWEWIVEKGWECSVSRD